MAESKKMTTEDNNSGCQNLKRFVCIEYPGIVNDIDKMMATLGGRDKISEVYLEKNRRLELRFRPSDSYCKPTCGERSNSTSLLIKVIRRKKKKKAKEIEGEETYKTEPIGIVHTTFKFNNMCDFQYLPVESSSNGTKLESIYHHLIPQGIQSSSWLDEPAPMFLPPAIFSRMNTPQDYRFRKDLTNIDCETKVPDNLICQTRQKRTHFAIFHNFKDEKVPEEPMAGAVAQLSGKFLEKESYDRLNEEFEKRPIWSKNALQTRLQLHKDKLKYLLPAVSYYSQIGPWRNLWVRYGYDPRKDPTAWVYQTFDFRVRQAGGMKTKVEAKRSYSNYLLPYKNVNLSKKKSSTIQSLHLKDEASSSDGPKNSHSKEESDRSSEDSYIFRPSTVPPYRQMFYQYCDIHVPEIHKYLEAAILSDANKICSEKNGWLPLGVENKCRDIMTNLVEKSLEQKNDESSVPKGDDAEGTDSEPEDEGEEVDEEEEDSLLEENSTEEEGD